MVKGDWDGEWSPLTGKERYVVASPIGAGESVSVEYSVRAANKTYSIPLRDGQPTPLLHSADSFRVRKRGDETFTNVEIELEGE